MKPTDLVAGFAPWRRLRRAPRTRWIVTVVGAALLSLLAMAPLAEAHGGGWDALGGFVAGTFVGAALRPPVVIAPAYYPAPVYAPVYGPPAYGYYAAPRPVVVYGGRYFGRRPHWYRRW
jgi:hypothetical protein